MFKKLLSLGMYNLGGAALSFVSTIILSRYVSVENFGLFGSVVTYGLILAYFFELGFPNSILSYTAKNKLNSFSDTEEIFRLYKKRVLILMMTSTTIALVYQKIYQPIYQFWFLISFGFITAVIRIIQSRYQAAGKIQSFNQISIAIPAVRFMAILIFVFFLYEISSLYFTWIILFLGYLLILISTPKKSVYESSLNKNEFANLTKVFFFNSIVTVLASRIDIVLGSRVISKTDLGYYFMAVTLAQIFPLITNSVIQLFTGNFMKGLRNSSLESYSQYLKVSVPGSLLILFIVFTATDDVLLWLNPSYVLAIPIFKALSVVHIIGVNITPLEASLTLHFPKGILGLKFSQLLLLCLVILYLSNLGVWALVWAVAISRFLAWIVLIGYYVRNS